MPKRKVEIPFVAGFCAPSEEDAKKAIGIFPCWSTNILSGIKKHAKREELLLGVSGGDHTTLSSIQQCDQEALYVNQYKGEPSWKPLPSPMDETAWLAKVHEEGQTFSQYVSMVTLRSGQFKPNTNHLQTKIYILPIIEHSENPIWPSSGPDLQGLSAWMSAFFSRDVEILDPVTLRPDAPDTRRKRTTKAKIIWQVGEQQERLVGRICSETGRFQTHVDGLLTQLSAIREDGFPGGGSSGNVDDAFSVVGVTMCDLYSCNSDLFVAGMAAGGSKVAVLSFARYHPQLKMSPEKWQDYGYIRKSSNYSYYEDNRRRPMSSPDVPSLTDMAAQAQAEYFRRAGKLLIHEMCHVYGIDHCIFYHCLMNGTAHLVEDFSSPCHICGVCLRKLQFRLGFDVKDRYQNLHDMYQSFGMKDEVKWAARKLESIAEEEEGEVEIGQEELEEVENNSETTLIVDLTQD
jgi:predicted Zn-dependent protease